MSQADLELAIRHVKEAEKLVAEQRVRIDRQKAEGRPTEQSEQMLQTMQEALTRLKSHRAGMTNAVEGGNLPN